MARFKKIFLSTSGDSFLLIFVRLITIMVSIFVTRLLSGYFSMYEYGTYSQVMLLVTTISSVTIMGMMDGINYFFCREKDESKRNSYISTIFFLQYAMSAVVSIVLLCCTVPVSLYFDNESLRPLIIFAAILPVLQNSISMLQIMFVAIGKTKQIAVRNFVLSLLKLLAVILACYAFDNYVVVLICQVLFDVAQVVYFCAVLRVNNCRINIFKFDKTLILEILKYCVPMAMFTVMKTLNRDCDKFVISALTDTETLAVYSNASKMLPFDIIMSSFCTVLLPYITRAISQRKYEFAHGLYKAFLELSYISTAIFAVGAICVAPELMRFLYTEKYISGIYVFIIYIVVEIISVLNITLLLSAAGKTKKIMFVSLGSFASNVILNLLFFKLWGIIGPAIATLLVTFLQGIVILSMGAKELGMSFFGMFNLKRLVVFGLQLVAVLVSMLGIRYLLVWLDVPYMVTLIGVYGAFAVIMLLLNFKRLKGNIDLINGCKSTNIG